MVVGDQTGGCGQWNVRVSSNRGDDSGVGVRRLLCEHPRCCVGVFCDGQLHVQMRIGSQGGQDVGGCCPVGGNHSTYRWVMVGC